MPTKTSAISLLHSSLPYLVCLAVLALALPSVAEATVHYGDETFAPPSVAPTIGPQLPTCNPQEVYPPETGNEEGPLYECNRPTESIHTVSVTYNDQTGSLTLKVTVFDPQLWGPVLNEPEGFSIGRNCNADERELDGDFEGPEATWENGRPPAENKVGLYGYQGEVEGTVAWTGEAHVFTWASAAFAHKDWRCVTLDATSQSFSLNGWPKSKTARARRRPAKKKSDHPGQEEIYGK
jgi:hypothetical protein